MAVLRVELVSITFVRRRLQATAFHDEAKPLMSDQGRATRRLLDVLNASWPDSKTIGPESVGLSGDEGPQNFIVALHALCDDGILSYEALVSDEAGTRAMGAYLTTRGRSLYTSN